MNSIALMLGLLLSMAEPTTTIIPSQADVKAEIVFREMASLGSYEEDVGEQAAAAAISIYQYVHPLDTLEAVKEYRRTLNMNDIEPSKEVLYSVAYLLEVEYKPLLVGR